MPTAIVTGSGGLIGSECVRHFVEAGFEVIGIDNDMRSHFFGASASTRGTSQRLADAYDEFRWLDLDIRDQQGIDRVFGRYGRTIELVVHTAAQPSHDWAARDPRADFSINATGTLNLLDSAKRHCPAATFIHCSTNKVYGDRPNNLPLVELETRVDLPKGHRYFVGIDASMSIDLCLHSLFGASKVAADIVVQEYGRYFDMPTACFRGGCLTGPAHAGAQLHGFLSYLMRCAVTGGAYTVFGYHGKQVRDNIHAVDCVRAFSAFHASPRPGAVYNLGGGRRSNCSVVEAIALCREITGHEVKWSVSDKARIGDHRWWISDMSAFERDYPEWSLTYDVKAILQEIYDVNAERWSEGARTAA